jgi:hypothetical protein
MEASVLKFWQGYLDSLPVDLDRQEKPASVFSFGDSREMADRLAVLMEQRHQKCNMLGTLSLHGLVLAGPERQRVRR